MVADSSTNLRTASLAIERNSSYLHQFIHRGTPKVLAQDDREALAEHLGGSRPAQARPHVDAPGAEACDTALRATREVQRGAGDRRNARLRVRGRGTTSSRKATKRAVRRSLIRHEFRARPRYLDVWTGTMEPALQRRPHPLRREPHGAGPARHLRHLGRHGAWGERSMCAYSDRHAACSSPQPPVRQLTNASPRRIRVVDAPSGSPAAVEGYGDPPFLCLWWDPGEAARPPTRLP